MKKSHCMNLYSYKRCQEDSAESAVLSQFERYTLCSTNSITDIQYRYAVQICSTDIQYRYAVLIPEICSTNFSQTTTNWRNHAALGTTQV